MWKFIKSLFGGKNVLMPDRSLYSRLWEAQEKGTPIKVLRTSGKISSGVIYYVFGSEEEPLVQAEITDEEIPLYKMIKIEKFLKYNPEFE